MLEDERETGETEMVYGFPGAGQTHQALHSRERNVTIAADTARAASTLAAVRQVRVLTSGVLELLMEDARCQKRR